MAENLQPEATQGNVAASNQNNNTDFFRWSGAPLLHGEVNFLCFN